MNRRDFMGTVVGGIAVAKLGAAGLGGHGADSAAAQAASASAGAGRQGAWIENGLIDAGGSHEPYIFIVRRGGQRLDAKQISDYEQSEGLIEQLHRQGVEVFHTHLYKGFGMAAEKEGMEDTRNAVAIAHRLGMKADTYIQWSSMMYETFFAEEPRATNWIERDIAGLPILITYGYQQSFRYMPCFTNQEYIDYLKKVVRYAIVEVKTDFIHFDNFNLNAEPDSCHCPWCVNGFRKYLRTKYSPAQLRERFGFENVSFVNPPQWNSDDPPDQMEIIYDPAFQEWIDFRCQTMADALQQVSGYAKSLHPEVAIEINPGGINGENRPWTSAIDHARLLKFTESFWSEERDMPAYLPDGRLISKIRSYKLARIYNNVMLTYAADDPVGMAEALAFNQTLGFVGSNPLSPETLRYIDFYRKNRDMYLQSEDVTTVAVFRSYASLTYNNFGTQLSAILVEQALIQSRVPFAIIFDEHIHRLSKYKVLVLPNSECLSEEQISLIRLYVEKGGGLVVTEQSGLYDNWRRVRTKPGLSGLVEGQISGDAYQEDVKSQRNNAGVPSRKQVGAGRVAYLPAVQFAGALPPASPYFAITNSWWKRPQNWRDIFDSVHWAAGGQLPLMLDGPEFLIANCTLQAGKQRFLVHLVNYNATETPTIARQKVRVVLPQNKKAQKVTLYAPDLNDARALNFTNDGSSVEFTVREMKTYAFIAIEW
ncbi:MAG: beta-galactosidase trimerization domain-containing protein [Acidobacteriaceae bacterium]